MRMVASGMVVVAVHIILLNNGSNQSFVVICVCCGMRLLWYAFIISLCVFGRAGGATSLSDLVKAAEAKTAQFESNEEFVTAGKERMGSGKAVEGSLKAYYKEFRKVRFLFFALLVGNTECQIA